MAKEAAVKIKNRERTAIINSLKAGIVPKIGLQHIQVGRAKEIKEMLNDFELISDGASKTRFIIGEFGSSSYPPRSLNNAGTSENLDFKPFFEVASAF